MQTHFRLKIRWHLVTLDLRQCYAVGAGVAVDGGRAERSRPCGWEPLAGLATVPAALILAGSAFAAMATPAKNAAARTVDLQRVSI
jgi:hypothetical protein